MHSGSVSVIWVSIIIPTYNRPEALRNCIRALQRQTYASEDFEVLVVDDGSTPPVDAAKLTDHECTSASNMHVRVIRQVNAGPAAARNVGVQKARGELVVFIDDDCLAEEGWLEKLIETHQQYPQALVGGECLNDVHDNIFSVTNQVILNCIYDFHNPNPQDVLFLASNNWLCRRDMFLDLGGFDDGFRQAGGEDWEFCFRWRSKGYRIVWQREARAKHLHHQDLSRFLNMHYRYGQGAFLFRQIVRRSEFKENSNDRDFYTRELPLSVLRQFRHLPGWGQRAKILLLLITWRTFDTLGYIREGIRSIRRNRRSPTSQQETHSIGSLLNTPGMSGESEGLIAAEKSVRI